MGCFRSADVRQLLHNKFVVILGDSIQRSVYKDLVLLLQDDRFLSKKQLQDRGEFNFENDKLIEGGQLTGMHNGTNFREVRQYRTGYHLVRYYFLTRVYSNYMESILSDFQSGPQPDVVIVSSCIWDINRYGAQPLEAYKTNLDILFQRLKEVLSPECLIIWSMTMPVGFKDHEMPENIIINLRRDIVEGNFFSATIANYHELDVLDMHFHFRGDLCHRWHDAIHWNRQAHRKYTQILLTHIASAWGVEVPEVGIQKESVVLPGYTSLDGNDIDDAPAVQRPVDSISSNAQQTPSAKTQDVSRPPSSHIMTESVFLPGYISFDGNDIDDVFGVQLAADSKSSDAVSPFVSDSPLLIENIRPGYFLPRPPGPMNFIPYPIHAPYPWNMTKKSKRGALKSRGNRIHPYR